MLDLADRSIEEIRSFLAMRGLEAGYLVPTETGLEKALMDAHGQVRDYLRREGVHDYASQEKGSHAKVKMSAWYVGADSFEETTVSLYRPETKGGDPRIWLSALPRHARPGNVLALLAHEGCIYTANLSDPEIWASANDPAAPLGQLIDKISAAKKRPIADKFSAWNIRLLSSFFSEASRGEEVFLRVDGDTLDEIGQDLGGNAGFLEAVRSGPPSRRPDSSLTDRVSALIRQRNLVAKRKPGSDAERRRLALTLELEGYVDPGDLDPTYRGQAAPAYLPYLAVFVRIAATSTQDGFYNQLRETLRLHEQFGSTQMACVNNAWADLERWAKERGGRFGHFKLRKLGGYEHIGVPQSQSVLKTGDIQRIPIIFKRAELRPDRELTDDLVSKVLAEAGAEAARAGSFFSKSFRSALSRPVFDAPVRSAIRAIYEDWDGKLPDRKRASDARPDQEDHRRGVGICLSVVQEEPLELAIHWSVPALHDSGSFELRHGDTTWAGAYVGAEDTATRPAPSTSGRIWEVAAEAFHADVDFELTSRLGDETEDIHQRIKLEQRLLWVLAPDVGGPDGRAWLREGDLPGHGTAFLLAPPDNAARLKNYLERERPDHEAVPALGMPEGWTLVRLNECGSLTESQRTLPDGVETRPVPRLIRLVGGRSVRRGYVRMYLPYDLPTVELDAPQGTVIEWPQGVAPIDDASARSLQGPALHAIKRFRLQLLQGGNAAYKLEARLSGQPIGSPAVLRISGVDGDLVELGQHFSLDPFGRPQPSADGLSGLLPESWTSDASGHNAVVVTPVPPQAVGGLSQNGVCAEHKFLDALAQPNVGAMDAGAARALIAKYLAEEARHDNPTFVLLGLRSRGHVEISTTQKGNMSRVHVVHPTIFQFPIQTGGKSVYGVLGTLRLSHWQALASGGSEWKPAFDNSGGAQLGAVRLIEQAPGVIEAACSASGSLGRRGFRLASFPSLAIASWSEALDVIQASIFRNPMDSIGRASEGAMRFNPVEGRFSARPSTFPLELWKTTDLDTGLGSVHYLVERQGAALHHAFVRDSRWGVWAVLEAFARHARDTFKREDVHPFPLTYDASEAVVWLPARLGLPVPLERALVLCSGALPDQFNLTADEGPLTGERVTLRRNSGGIPELQAHPAYYGMANGKWLAYRWVPEPVAHMVAKKLGARLDVL